MVRKRIGLLAVLGQSLTIAAPGRDKDLNDLATRQPGLGRIGPHRQRYDLVLVQHVGFDRSLTARGGVFCFKVKNLSKVGDFFQM